MLVMVQDCEGVVSRPVAQEYCLDFLLTMGTFNNSTRLLLHVSYSVRCHIVSESHKEYFIP